MVINEATLAQWESQVAVDDAKAIMALALKQFENIAISFSGAEDVVLVHLAAQIKPGVTVFSLDTGRLHPETYQLIETVRDTYPINLQIAFPDPEQVQTLVEQKGLFSFFKDGHKECCAIRKVGPLRKILSTKDAWVTGQRHDQSPGTRQDVPIIQMDKFFAGPDRTLVKFNPLSNWTSEQVWRFIRSEGIPYNALHEKGFTSIGCEPCTKPILPNQHEREGRWWWEEATQKECGLHAINVKG